MLQVKKIATALSLANLDMCAQPAVASTGEEIALNSGRHMFKQ